MPLTRRQFIHSTLAAGAASLTPQILRGNAHSPNDTIGVAIIGCGRKSPEHIELFGEIPGVQITALCDCDTAHMDQVAPLVADARVKQYVDVRDCLQDPDVDVAVIATPNHWHALMTVWACQAGKDVYVEKPVCHSIWEGRQMVAAARKYNRIVQAGTQNRSDVGLIEARKFLHAGGIGKIKLVRTFDYTGIRAISKTDGPQSIPKTANYDLFQGPAPLVPLFREHMHYDWHFFYDTGNGDTGNRGIHNIDHARWLVGGESMPKQVRSIAGRFTYNDDGETPNVHTIHFDCDPVPMIYQLCGLMAHKGAPHKPTFRGKRTSTIIECEDGYLMGGRGGATAYTWKDERIEKFSGDGGRGHQKNFIDAVRSRRRQDLAAEIEEGHISTGFCHLGLISHQTGYHRQPEEIKAAFQDNPVLYDQTGYVFNLLKANGVDLQSDPFTLGADLTFNPKKETFTGAGSEWANMYLRRQYRTPFVMPEKV